MSAFTTTATGESEPALASGGPAARVRWSLYVLVFLAALVQNALTPLLPAYAGRFDLGATATGILVGAASLSMLAVTFPAGSLADRFGARRLTLAAGLLLVLAAAGQGLAPSFSLLVLARLLFGAGYGILWTAGLAWLASVSGGRRVGIGATVAVSGAGAIVGPVCAGVLSEELGLAGPFLVAGALVLLATLVLSRSGSSDVSSHAPCVQLGSAMRMVAGDLRVVTAVCAVVVTGILYGVTTLLVPLELHGAGMSAGAIGMVFSGAATLYLAASLVTSALGRRVVTVAATVTICVLGALSLAPAGLSAAPLVVIGVLCAAAASRSALWTVIYPLGEAGAVRAGVGLGVVFGLLNAASAITTFATPLMAGIFADSFGRRATFELAVVACVGIFALWWAYQRAHASGRIAGDGTMTPAGLVQGCEAAARVPTFSK